MPRVAVIILNWNGEKLLRTFLPSVIAYTNPEFGSIIVADNASTDASLEMMRHEFQDVRLICFDRNYGFAGGYNRAIREVSEEIVILLNSDVEVGEKWLEPLVNALDNQPLLAAVQPKIKSWKEKEKFEYAGACGGYMDYLGFPFCRGRILDTVEKDYGQYDQEQEVFWCSGAALCIRREVYLQAGGLDERFFAHMEEIDLCWRLRNKGAQLKVIPQSIVYHLGGGSLPMNHPRKLFLNYRNNLLMLYKNMSPSRRRMVMRKRFWLDTAAMLMFMCKGKWKNVAAIWKAYAEYRQMKKEYTPAGKNGNDPCIFRKSMVICYYFRHIRTFSCLWK